MRKILVLSNFVMMTLVLSGYGRNAEQDFKTCNSTINEARDTINKQRYEVQDFCIGNTEFKKCITNGLLYVMFGTLKKTPDTCYNAFKENSQNTDFLSAAYLGYIGKGDAAGAAKVCTYARSRGYSSAKVDKFPLMNIGLPPDCKKFPFQEHIDQMKQEGLID